MTVARPEEIFLFWKDAGPKKWFEADPAFDREITARFLETYEAGVRGELDHWERSAYGAFALVILLDQFPRNMFRDDPRAFASDEHARALANEAIARDLDTRSDAAMRPFIYMPLMHSENMHDQERCVALFEKAGIQENLHFARLHADIIRRFGRFPHRNKVLGRTSSAEEQAFLDAGGFAG